MEKPLASIYRLYILQIYLFHLLTMSTQIVFKAKNKSLKEKFASRAKADGVPMSTILNYMMEEYITGKISFGLLHTMEEVDFHELSSQEISSDVQQKVTASHQKPLSNFVNI